MPFFFLPTMLHTRGGAVRRWSTILQSGKAQLLAVYSSSAARQASGQHRAVYWAHVG